MSTFSVDVVSIENVLPIPNADAIELAQIGGYVSVIRKGQYKPGDKVIYIPEDSILPLDLISYLGLTGKLSGSQKNRVKAVMLRGQLSQGIVMPAKPEHVLGSNVAEELGITKFEVEIPTHLTGKVANAMMPLTMTYDVENIKKYLHYMIDGEEVVITEKIHGTCCIMTLLHENDIFSRRFCEVLSDGEPFVTAEKEVQIDFYVASKGLSKEGLVFCLEENPYNVYCQAAIQNQVREHMLESLVVREFMLENGGPFHLFGEVFGSGVQDLAYTDVVNKKHFRVFDAYIGRRGVGRFLNDAELERVVVDIGLERVPVLYKGPYSYETLQSFTNGKETVSGKSLHIREGVVVRPTIERTAPGVGFYNRVQFKSVSADYLLRKNKDATEYQ